LLLAETYHTRQFHLGNALTLVAKVLLAQQTAHRLGYLIHSLATGKNFTWFRSFPVHTMKGFGFGTWWLLGTAEFSLIHGLSALEEHVFDRHSKEELLEQAAQGLYRFQRVSFTDRVYSPTASKREEWTRAYEEFMGSLLAYGSFEHSKLVALRDAQIAQIKKEAAGSWFAGAEDSSETMRRIREVERQYQKKKKHLLTKLVQHREPLSENFELPLALSPKVAPRVACFPKDDCLQDMRLAIEKTVAAFPKLADGGTYLTQQVLAAMEKNWIAKGYLSPKPLLSQQLRHSQFR
jgi:hypothetical protein